MVEIKSTLELVLEKTKGLTLSQEDRAEQRNKGIKLKVEGLLRKYRNRELRKEQLENECKDLKEVYGVAAIDIVINEFLDSIDLGGDVRLVLDFLKGFLKLNVESVEFLFENYEKALLLVTQERVSQLKKILEWKHCLSGSAVLPNVEGDNTWQAAVKEIKERFYRQLSEEKEKIKKIFLSAPH